MMRIDTLDAGAALAREMELAGGGVGGAVGAAIVASGKARKRLVAPKKMASLPGFEEAVEGHGGRAAGPCICAPPGGDVTPQGPGIVNVTHVYTVDRRADFSIEGEYDRLCQPIEVLWARVPRAAGCPGPFVTARIMCSTGAGNLPGRRCVFAPPPQIARAWR